MLLYLSLIGSRGTKHARKTTFFLVIMLVKDGDLLKNDVYPPVLRTPVKNVIDQIVTGIQ
tara:strand:+ start:127 stop:306 length:180 start_codon:yes stop_codon:yes gene_type:complete